MIGVVPWLGLVNRKSKKVKNPLDFFIQKEMKRNSKKEISYLEINGQYI